MKLTIAKVRRFTERALKDRGIKNAKIISIEWIGKRTAVTRRLGRCEYKEYFRVGVYKYATLDSNNGFCIR